MSRYTTALDKKELAWRASGDALCPSRRLPAISAISKSFAQQHAKLTNFTQSTVHLLRCCHRRKNANALLQCDAAGILRPKPRTLIGSSNLSNQFNVVCNSYFRNEIYLFSCWSCVQLVPNYSNSSTWSDSVSYFTCRMRLSMSLYVHDYPCHFYDITIAISNPRHFKCGAGIGPLIWTLFTQGDASWP